jgi:hypothetical protein
MLSPAAYLPTRHAAHHPRFVRPSLPRIHFSSPAGSARFSRTYDCSICATVR